MKDKVPVFIRLQYDFECIVKLFLDVKIKQNILFLKLFVIKKIKKPKKYR